MHNLISIYKFGGSLDNLKVSLRKTVLWRILPKCLQLCSFRLLVIRKLFPERAVNGSVERYRVKTIEEIL
jgi:hypothetical protein